MFYDLWADDHAKRAVATTAMRLGYEGIAITHTVAGKMSETDRSSNRCVPMKMEALITASPGLEQSTRFHRSLLGVSATAPYRQYTRINVVVEDQVQAGALNSANPVLHSYDIVSVQPQNQKMLLLACTQMEVDVISLDFTQKLKFRVKTCNIKTAVERGIVFEICYGPAVTDQVTRREILANAKLLVASARGRHIILSSGAKSIADVRGPNDVINMGTMFGLSLEQAKAAISTTCKSVLMRGYMRRSTYKGAIAIERIEKPLFEVPAAWDPLATSSDCFLSQGEEVVSNSQTTEAEAAPDQDFSGAKQQQLKRQRETGKTPKRKKQKAKDRST